VDGQNFRIPRPEDVAPLHLFAKAMGAAEQANGDGFRKIASQKPQMHLGNLAIERSLRAPRPKICADESLFPEISRHIALMRPVKLVVKYLEGQPFPDEQVEWAGVFITDTMEAVERAFADSEPPAHDDWIPDNLPKGHSKTFVNVALRQLKEAAFEMGVVARGHASQNETGPPLARVASRLGAALDGTLGDGAGPVRKGTVSTGKRPLRARASKPLFLRLQRGTDGPVAVFQTEIRQDAGKTGAILAAKASVAIDGGPASGIDGTAEVPQVIAIRGMNGAPSSEGNRLVLDGSEGVFEILVGMPRDAAVIVDALVSTGELA
jgi:hypothetical protein